MSFTEKVITQTTFVGEEEDLNTEFQQRTTSETEFNDVNDPDIVNYDAFVFGANSYDEEIIEDKNFSNQFVEARIAYGKGDYQEYLYGQDLYIRITDG